MIFFKESKNYLLLSTMLFLVRRHYNENDIYSEKLIMSSFNI